RFAEAAAAWHEALALARGLEARLPEARRLRRIASEALAVHYEHRSKDPALALQLARLALETGPGPAARDALRYRLARLERKLSARIDW
ncbi:MAG TPA: hypothetical protein VNI83_12880, partial [Vicinamibacterales bacterium]|nr:hypothetical protein [Vicinamibacterales bacterium]